MPRTEKEPRQHKYNRQYLEVLSRKKLQAIAKRVGIKANIGSKDIVCHILKSRAVEQLLEGEQTKRYSPLSSVSEHEAPGDPIEADLISQPKSPGPQDDSEEVLNLGHIKDARRIINEINDGLTSSESTLDDIREILTHANARVTKGQEKVKGMVETRIKVEENIVKKLHVNRDLWDGTGLMPARHRVRWKEHVKQSERKIAAEKERTEKPK